MISSSMIVCYHALPSLAPGQLLPLLLPPPSLVLKPGIEQPEL